MYIKVQNHQVVVFVLLYLDRQTDHTNSGAMHLYNYENPPKSICKQQFNLLYSTKFLVTKF